MMTFDIEPFVGPLPLCFGMKPIEVESLIGSPDKVFLDHFGNRSETRLHMSFGYDASSGLLIETVFSVGSQLNFRGIDLLTVSDPINLLSELDPNPQLCVGMIFFVKLGIRISGFHDNDESQKAIALTRANHWDEFIDSFVPFRPRLSQ